MDLYIHTVALLYENSIKRFDMIAVCLCTRRTEIDIKAAKNLYVKLQSFNAIRVQIIFKIWKILYLLQNKSSLR